MPFQLETPRLLLRSFEERDILPFAAYRSDPEVARYQGWSAPYPVEEAARFVAEMAHKTPGAPGEWYQVAIELKSSGEMIGDCAFHLSGGHPAELAYGQAEIAYTLARPHQGQGYASEALTRLLDYLFFDLNLHRVQANVDPGNAPSIRLLLRLGLRHEGRCVESLWFKGRWADEDWYAMLQKEWPARWSGAELNLHEAG